jgi:hypothetical protein
LGQFVTQVLEVDTVSAKYLMGVMGHEDTHFAVVGSLKNP